LKSNPRGAEVLRTRIITPASGLSLFGDAARDLVSAFPAARELAWRLFLRDTRADHRQSLLGYFWLVVPALASTLTWVFLNGQKVINIETGDIAYPLFVLAGTILWTAFNTAVMAMLGVVGAARGILAKVNFPHEALVYSGMLKSALDALLAMLLVFPAAALFGAPWTVRMVGFPIALFACLTLGWALGLLFLPIAALYSDVSRAIQLVLRFGFFLTPVIFMMPSTGIGRRIMLLNPVTPLIVSGRTWLAGSGDVLATGFFVVFASSLAVILFGLVFYKVALPQLIERLSG
jgi:lipopolysaccharide transport system permease protein